MEPTPPQTLGAYYQCHKNAASFVRATQSFQKHYPQGTVVVVNDGGLDYAHFCQQHGIRYSYHPKQDTHSNALLFGDATNTLIFLKRLWDSLPLYTESHIILLEDDVRVLRPHTIPFAYTINGCNPNALLSPVLASLVDSQGYGGPYFYGACGGCILDREFLMAIPFINVEKVILSIPSGGANWASDLILSFIVRYFGGTIGQFSEFAETWYSNISELIRNNRIAFLHQYKDEYDNRGVTPTADEMKLLGWDKP
jgi:hypothetical protein